MDEVAQQIIQWGKEHSADFPWRHPKTPYESAVAEILLIRTPPHQVLPVYREFLVDANSVRFIERYYCRTFSGEARRNKQLIAAMDELTSDNPTTAIAFAEGFLDFMRDVCRPVNPLCNECCLSNSCRHCHIPPE